MVINSQAGQLIIRKNGCDLTCYDSALVFGQVTDKYAIDHGHLFRIFKNVAIHIVFDPILAAAPSCTSLVLAFPNA
jgi:hypothetical protein